MDRLSIALKLGILFIAFVIWLRLIIFVDKDAKERKLKCQSFWTTLTFFFNIVGFLLYLLFRPKKGRIKCDYCGFDLTKELKRTNIFICPNCKRLIRPEIVGEIFFSKIEKFNHDNVKIMNLKDGEFGEKLSEDSCDILSVVKFYISQAVSHRATDIHFDPEEEKIRVRERIDGILYDVIPLPRDLGIRLISAIKNLASLDVAQKKEPQGGHFNVDVNNRGYDLRISTSYSIFGERIAIRVLDRSGELLKLEKLGLSEDDLRQLEDNISKPQGMILICGPTGCGKSTTLYSILKRLSSKKNIMTIEDPVEYELRGVSQQQINPKAGIDFATGLRSILRQDPDVIMVGEIRDAETAQIAIQAADTGHLVLSTMHSIDTANVITRLREFGISPHYLSTSLLIIVAQRLIRKLCPHCKKKVKNQEGAENEITNIYEPKGCPKCNYTGFRGRTGIFEILNIDKEVRDLILRDISPSVLRDNYGRLGIETLREKGVKKVLNGQTTLEEVNSVAP